MSAAAAPRSVSASGFYHCSVKGVGRAAGRSVVAAAAYRAGERLHDDISGMVADYQLRHGVLDTLIVTPDNAPSWAHDRERLWNEAERAETRANGRLATELELALPHELTDAQRKELVTDFVRGIVERHGVAADVAIHAPGEGRDHRNVHAHVLITHRELGADGYGDIANERTIMKKVKGQERETKIAGIAATPADIRAIRQEWEHIVNRAYERAGLDIHVDHRSHEERGIEAEPTKHLGPTATAMERRGVESERGDANREITQRNAERRELAALESEAREIGAQIIDLAAERAMREAQAAAQGRTDDTRAEFTAASARATEPVAPTFDRDAGEAAWLDQVAAAGIAKDEATRVAQEARRQSEPDAGETRAAGPSGDTEKRPEAEDVRPLGKTAADIRTAWSLARSAGELDEALAAHGITLAQVSAEEARQSERVAAFAREVGNFARVLQEGEIVAVDGRGDVHRFDQRTTGELHPDIEARLPGIGAGLLNVTAAKAAMREADHAAWRDERQAERENARPPTAIEIRIADCAEQSLTSGAVVERDGEGRRITGAEALADRLRPDGAREIETVTEFGPEAFAALLEQAGIAIARVTAGDVQALDALWHDEDMARLVAETNREARRTHHFAQLAEGDLAAVTRAGDVHRINPDKLGDAVRQLAADLPSVTEVRAALEIDRAQTSELWAERRAEIAAQREDDAADREMRAAVRAVEREAQQTIATAEHAVDGGFSAAGRAVEGFARSVIAFLSGWFDAPVRLTPDEVHRREQVAPQQAEARAVDEAAQRHEAARDWQISEQNRQEQDFAARFGTPPSRDRDRDDDRERGYERER